MIFIEICNYVGSNIYIDPVDSHEFFAGLMDYVKKHNPSLEGEKLVKAAHNLDYPYRDLIWNEIDGRMLDERFACMKTDTGLLFKSDSYKDVVNGNVHVAGLITDVHKKRNGRIRIVDFMFM